MGFLDHKKDQVATQSVVRLYREILEEEGRISKFVKLKVGKATEESIEEFVALAERLEKKVGKMLRKAIGRYSEEWCQDTFHTSYPPLAVVVGRSSRKWLAQKYNKAPKVKASSADIERQAEEIVNNLLGIMHVDQAIVTIDAGWPPDERLRARIKEVLNARKQDRQTPQAGPSVGP